MCGSECVLELVWKGKVSSQANLSHRAKHLTCLIYAWLASVSWIDEAEIHRLILDGLGGGLLQL